MIKNEVHRILSIVISLYFCLFYASKREMQIICLKRLVVVNN